MNGSVEQCTANGVGIMHDNRIDPWKIWTGSFQKTELDRPLSDPDWVTLCFLKWVQQVATCQYFAIIWLRILSELEK